MELSQPLRKVEPLRRIGVIVDKTMRNVIITGIAMILVATGLSAVVLLGGCSKASSVSLDGTRIDAVNAVIDKTGIKSQLDAEARVQARALASEYGMPDDLADQVVDSLAIEDWEVTTLPQGVAETSNFSMNVEGQPIQITTYDDESVVTVGAYGHEITFAVPESAQTYMPYVPYLAYLE